MNGQWSLFLAAEATQSCGGRRGWGSRFFSANLKSSLCPEDAPPSLPWGEVWVFPERV